MKVCTCFLLFRIFAYTHSVASNTPRDSQRSVNLALETVLEFSDKDKAGDIKFLDNVQNFITKVKTVIDKNNVKSDYRRDFKALTVTTFTGFIQKVINILNTYENTKFKQFFEILDEEIRKYHYRGCKFYELTENYEIRKQIATKLDSIKSKPTSDIKDDINTLSETLKNVNNDKNIKEIVDYINSLYRQDAREKFQNILFDLQAYGKSKSKNNLGEIIKNTVRSILFDHYTNLNTNVRRDVKQKVETFWKRFNENSPPMSNIPNNKTSYNIMNEVKKLKPVSRKHTAEIKQSDFKDSTKRDNLKRDKKRNKHTRKDNIDKPLKVQEKDKRILSPQRPKVQQRTQIKTQEQLNNVNSLSSESLEFYKEPKDKTQQKKMTSKKNSTNSRNKSEKIRTENLTTRILTNYTVPNIWIEESTGRLPKTVLDKLANKPRGQEPDHNATEAVNKQGVTTRNNKKYSKGQKSWHGKIYELKHGKEYDKKSESKKSAKHLSKYKSRQGPRQKSNEDKKLKSDKNSQLLNMELHQYKNSMGLSKLELNDADRSSAAATKSLKFLDVTDVPMISAKSSKTFKPLRGGRTTATKKLAAPIRTQRLKYNDVRRMKAVQRNTADLEPHKELSKMNQILSRKFETQADNSLEHPTSSEGMTVEQFEIKGGKKPGHQLQKTVTSLEKDLYVIEKIKNLEKELEEVKSKIKYKAEVKHSEPKENKEIIKLSDTRTGSIVNRFIDDSKLRPVQLETAGTADNKTVFIDKHVQKIGFKYNDIKDNIHTSKSGINVNAHNEKVIELQQSSEPTKLKRKLSITKLTPPRISKSVTDSKPRQDKPEITETMDNKATKNIYVQQLVPKYNKIVDDLKKDQNKLNFNADVVKVNEIINDVEKKQDGLLQIATEINKKESLTEFVKDKHFQNNDISKKIETSFRSNVNIIPNEFKDRKEKSKVTKIVDSKTDKKTKNVNMEFLNEFIKNQDLKIIDKDKKSETIFRSDLNNISNYLKNETEKPKVARLASNREDKYSENNKIKDNIEEVKNEINVNADILKTTRETEVKNLPQHKEPNKEKGKLAKTRHKGPHINRFILDSLPTPNLPEQKKTSGNDNGLLTKNTYVQNVASKYHKIMADFGNNSSGMNANAGFVKASLLEDRYEPKKKHQLLNTMPEDQKSLKMYNDFEAMTNRLLEMTKIEPYKVKETKINVNNINKGIEAKTNDLQYRTEIANLTETADGRTDLIEKAKKSKMDKETVGNDHETIIVTEKQEIIVSNDFSPEKKDAAIEMMKYRSSYGASKGTGTENRKIESTRVSEPSTDATATAAVTAPTTLELSTIEVFIPEATITQSPFPWGT